MMRSGFACLSPAGPRARLSTLIFHRVLPRRDELSPGEVTAREFDAICGWLKRWFNVLPLDEAVQRLAQGQLPARAACITFDDGYADNCTVALPILQRHGLPATFFIATGFINGGRMWNDTVIETVRSTPLEMLDLRGAGIAGLAEISLASVEQRRAAIGPLLLAIKHLPPSERDLAVAAVVAAAGLRPSGLPANLMMSSDQVCTLRRAGMQIGAHTVNHPILASLSDAEARLEIKRSRGELQTMLGEPVALFAYPNGRPGQDYSRRDVDLVRELGFAAAVSTAWGASQQGTDRFQLPRFTPWDRSRVRFGLRLAQNLALQREAAVVPTDAEGA